MVQDFCRNQLICSLALRKAFPFGEGGAASAATEEVFRQYEFAEMGSETKYCTAPLPALRATLPIGEGIRQTTILHTDMHSPQGSFPFHLYIV